jgi:hypothetical protein
MFYSLLNDANIDLNNPIFEALNKIYMEYTKPRINSTQQTLMAALHKHVDPTSHVTPDSSMAQRKWPQDTNKHVSTSQY